MKRRKRMLEELDQDISDHIERETQDNIERGMSPEEARYAAMRKFGNVTRVKEETREVWSPVWIEQLLADIRFGLRMLRKNRGFTTVIVLTLALGIGANTAIFSVVNAVLLRPLPYPDPERIVRIGLRTASDELDDVTVAQLAFLRDHGSTVFDAVAGYRGDGTVALEQNRKLEWVNSLAVTDGFFSTLGIAPALGRDISRSETQPGSSRSVILTDSLWRRSFGADPGVIGAQISLNDGPYTVTGVLPRDFAFIQQPADVFVSLQFGHNLGDTGTNTEVIARLKPAETLPHARSALSVLFPQLPDRGGVLGLAAESYQQALAGDVRASLFVLFGAVGLLLLIACANVASLILARASTRAREMSVRLALGASRGRLLRQLLVESLLVAVIGAAVGLVAAFWSLHSLASSIPWELPQAMSDITIDGRVLAFAVGAAALTSVLFAIASFWQSVRMNVSATLKESGRQGNGGAMRHSARNFLVVGEVALSLTLLVGAAFLAATLYNLRNQKLGFDPENVVTLTTPYPRIKPLTSGRVWSFEQELLTRIQSVPGVTSAAVVTVAPLDGQANLPAQVAGLNDPSHSWGGTEIRVISSRYFETMQIPVLQGRAILESDAAGSQPVAVINESLARRWWDKKSPEGERIVIGEYLGRELFDSPDPPRIVVGVVADVKGMLLNRPAPPMVYIPAAQGWGPMNDSTAWVIRIEPGVNLGNSIRAAVTEVDPALRMSSLRPMSKVVGNSMASQSFDALLLGLFAAVALALACVGIYGVLSLFVNQRSREIGIRMALGAAPRQVLRLVLAQGLVLAALGVAIGIAAAFGLTHFLRGLLFGVRSTSLLPYAVGTFLLMCVALLASYIPARRAMRVDPIVALRYE
jgi:putative ABC transport system permease protein